MLILTPASPARGRCDTSGLQEAGKICAVTPEQEQREDCDDEGKGEGLSGRKIFSASWAGGLSVFSDGDKCQ
jgi:hypothetical protein